MPLSRDRCRSTPCELLSGSAPGLVWLILLLLFFGAGAHGCHELWIIPQHRHSHWPVVRATRQLKQQLQGPGIHFKC
jgi:hypothetical protein